MTQQIATKKINKSGEWYIWVSGYGGFSFTGTEIEAEDMRKHKANWERGSGWKYRTGAWATEADKVTEQIVDEFEQGEGVPQSLMSKRYQLMKAEGRL